jgi:hypothetical protein
VSAQHRCRDTAPSSPAKLTCIDISRMQIDA